MPTKEEIEVAVKVINEIAGAPDTGIIADLISDIVKSGVTTKEVRVTSAKETR
jgi:ATP phosphoribosyltransferase